MSQVQPKLELLDHDTLVVSPTQKRHGLTGTPEHIIWVHMRQRVKVTL